MQRLLLRFRKEHSLEPSLFVRKNTIKAMTLWLEKTRITICNVPVRKQPKEFNDWMNKFKRAIFTEDLKSAYSPNFRIAFSEMRMPQLCARFITDAPDYALGVDVARCYPAAVMMEKTIPVLLHSDDFRAYDGHTIQDDYYYYFENDDRWSIEKWFICKRRFGVRKGYVLNRCGLTFRILGFCAPTKLYDNPFPAILKDLYEAPVSKEVKRLAPNFTIGTAGKMKNRGEQCFFTTSHAEACSLASEPKSENVSTARALGGYFATRETDDVLLHEGYYPIQDAAYGNTSLMMLQTYRRLLAEGITVYGIKTDCFYVDRQPDWCYAGEPDVSGVPQEIAFTDIGRNRREKLGRVPLNMWEVEDNKPLLTLCDPPEPKLVEKKTNGVNTAVLAELPGAGKTYTSALGLDPQTTLFITGCNDRCDKIMKGEGLPEGIGFPAVTCASVLGIRVAGDGEVYNKSKTND